jgi:hypothetical protein
VGGLPETGKAFEFKQTIAAETSKLDREVARLSRQKQQLEDSLTTLQELSLAENKSYKF